MAVVPSLPSQPIPEADECALLARLRVGDERAYEQLLSQYGGRLLAVARRMMGNEEDARDAVQEAMLSAFKALDRFDGKSKLSTWLHRIVVNACLMRMRAKGRRPEVSIDGLLPRFQEDGHRRDPGPVWKSLGSANPSPGSGIEGTETRRLVRANIDRLPEGYRTVLMLRDIEGLDTEQAAIALEMTPNAVKTRLHRARQALRELLDADMRLGSPKGGKAWRSAIDPSDERERP
jgi:RNA polymerase sigma-70 factor, ECF subfamily